VREKEKKSEGGKGKEDGRERPSKGRRKTWADGVKKGRTGRVEGRSREGRRKEKRKGEGLRRKLQYRNTVRHCIPSAKFSYFGAPTRLVP